MSVALEPLRLFSEFNPHDNRRPDILLRNPHGGGKQAIIDVAVVGIDGSSRHINDNPFANIDNKICVENSKVA